MVRFWLGFVLLSSSVPAFAFECSWFFSAHRLRVEAAGEYIKSLPLVDRQSNAFLAEDSGFSPDRGDLREVDRDPNLTGRRSYSELAVLHPDFWSTVQKLNGHGWRVLINPTASGFRGLNNGFARVITLSPNADWSVFRHEIHHIEFFEKVTSLLLRQYAKLPEDFGPSDVLKSDYSQYFDRFVAHLRVNQRELRDPYLRKLLKAYRWVAMNPNTFLIHSSDSSVNEILTTAATMHEAITHSVLNLGTLLDERRYQLGFLVEENGPPLLSMSNYPVQSQAIRFFAQTERALLAPILRMVHRLGFRYRTEQILQKCGVWTPDQGPAD